MSQRQDVIDFQGGLDLVTPYLRVNKGAVTACLNYESEARGYRRMQGYERFDGRLSPTGAAYYVLNFDSGSVAISEDDTVTGDTSGTVGTAIADAVVTSGSWAGGDAAGYVPLYNKTLNSSFQDNEGLEVSAVNVATADGVELQAGADNDTDADAWLQAAIEKRRAVIATVPGEGDIRGVCSYKGDIYAFRDNVGSTQGVMHKATSSGWVAQSFGKVLDFTSGGTTAIAEGDTITGGTSGATATVERVVLQSNSWSGGNAVGYLVLSGQSGTFQAENLDVGGSANLATIGGDSSDITLPTGGRYRTIVHNFYGIQNLKRLYFTNGVGYGMEWDGSVLVPVKTSETLSSSVDTPSFCGVHSNHLLLGYDGGSIQFSSIGKPTEFNAVDGAGEFGLGDDITGMLSSTRTSTVITCRNKIAYLSGNDATDFVMSDIAQDSGAVADTLAAVNEPYFLDDRGVRSLSAAQEYGDWALGTVTSKIEPLFDSKRKGGVLPVGAFTVRSKDQYRLFYDDKSVISIYFGRSPSEVMLFQLEFTPTCVHSGEDIDQAEALFAAGTDGYVYQLDLGNSADGQPVEALLRTSWLFQGSPTTVKRYFRAFLDVASGSVDTTLSYSSDFTFGNEAQPSGVEASFSIDGGGGFWDEANWDEFFWSSPIQDQAIAELNGVGKNVSIALISSGTYENVHTLSSLTVNYAPRRTMR